jgi:hypothetical protein
MEMPHSLMNRTEGCMANLGRFRNNSDIQSLILTFCLGIQKATEGGFLDGFVGADGTSVQAQLSLLGLVEVCRESAFRVVQAVREFSYQATVVSFEVLFNFRDKKISRIFVDEALSPIFIDDL